MLFRAHLLRVDPAVVGSIEYFLMVMQMPKDGRMEARTIVEGAHVGYLSPKSLKESFERAGVGDEAVNQLERALSSHGSLVFLGVMDLDAPQLRELGFHTLANMAETLRYSEIQISRG